LERQQILLFRGLSKLLLMIHISHLHDQVAHAISMHYKIYILNTYNSHLRYDI
jgi:hypothetical protein